MAWSGTILEDFHRVQLKEQTRWTSEVGTASRSSSSQGSQTEEIDAGYRKLTGKRAVPLPSWHWEHKYPILLELSRPVSGLSTSIRAISGCGCRVMMGAPHPAAPEELEDKRQNRPKRDSILRGCGLSSQGHARAAPRHPCISHPVKPWRPSCSHALRWYSAVRPRASLHPASPEAVPHAS
jgi:hypothetical protein